MTVPGQPIGNRVLAGISSKDYGGLDSTRAGAAAVRADTLRSGWKD